MVLMGKFGQDAEVTPLLFSKDILGFLMITESQDLGLRHRPRGEHPLLASLTPLPAAT